MPEEQSLALLMSGLGETSSLHGVPKIVTSRQRIVKILWCILLLGAVCVTSLQIYKLGDEYYSYPTKTSMKIHFSSLPFPAATFCNMNPIKWQALRHNDQLYDIFFDNIIADIYPDYLGDDKQQHNNTRDEYYSWKSRFLTGIQNISKDERMKLGHQAKDFILGASFAGQPISLDSFSTTFSHLYGNCFTLDLDDVVARGSGLEFSLYFVFNVENEEYIEDYSSSYGVRLVLHEKGTYPLPAVEGITLSTNYETHIGVRMTRIRRLGGKYGNCTDGRDFEKKYNTNYTIPLCYSVCQTESFVTECGCRPLSTPDFMNVSEEICNHDKHAACLKNTKNKILRHDIHCSCRSRCEENVYTTTLSGRLWPHKAYLASVLVKESCKRNITMPVGVCALLPKDIYLDNLTQAQYQSIRSNFLSVYIYFEDLNFEEISEDPLYNPVRFLSDIGGALGLYIGASALTCVEIIQLILELILFFRGKMIGSGSGVESES